MENFVTDGPSDPRGLYAAGPALRRPSRTRRDENPRCAAAVTKWNLRCRRGAPSARALSARRPTSTREETLLRTTAQPMDLITANDAERLGLLLAVDRVTSMARATRSCGSTRSPIRNAPSGDFALFDVLVQIGDRTTALSQGRVLDRLLAQERAVHRAAGLGPAGRAARSARCWRSTSRRPARRSATSPARGIRHGRRRRRVRRLPLATSANQRSDAEADSAPHQYPASPSVEPRDAYIGRHGGAGERRSIPRSIPSRHARPIRSSRFRLAVEFAVLFAAALLLRAAPW